MNQLRIGGESEYVLFQLPSSEVRNGWFHMTVNVCVPGFNGSVLAYFEPIDFKLFAEQLQSLYQTLQGTAEFRPVEKQILVVLTGNGRGGIEVTGEIASQTWQNKLEYLFEIDQTFLIKTLNQLESFHSGRADADA